MIALYLRLAHTLGGWIRALGAALVLMGIWRGVRGFLDTGVDTADLANGQLGETAEVATGGGPLIVWGLGIACAGYLITILFSYIEERRGERFDLSFGAAAEMVWGLARQGFSRVSG